MPARHQVLKDEINPDSLSRILLKTYETHPQNFEALLGIRGVGAKTLRALSLLSELIYGAQPSFRDPARFSYAHGGKDGHPYPVNREAYDSPLPTVRNLVRGRVAIQCVYDDFVTDNPLNRLLSAMQRRE